VREFFVSSLSIFLFLVLLAAFVGLLPFFFVVTVGILVVGLIWIAVQSHRPVLLGFIFYVMMCFLFPPLLGIGIGSIPFFAIYGMLNVVVKRFGDG